MAIGRGISLPWIESESVPQVNWCTEVQSQRPIIQINIEGKLVSGMIDTGADVSVIDSAQWDPSWPLMSSTTPILGVGGHQGARKAERHLRWSYEGQSGFIRPLKITGLGSALWGRDLLHQLQLYLTTPEHLATNS
ncbi:endogenous retrovirus group K member 25 Pro protein-like [Macrotis lagotis]|uniref:endogenous retrovirus group K member 25 Pro protein-like n=1 Tax=Macrotis lagotis TaxID=92651 RepID=UPI003D698BDC